MTHILARGSQRNRRAEHATVITSNFVLTELADGMAKRARRKAFIAFFDDLRSGSDIVIIPATRDLFERGYALYRSRLDKEWSLTDCTSFIVMGDRKISDALTEDHHFEQAGFKALLR